MQHKPAAIGFSAGFMRMKVKEVYKAFIEYCKLEGLAKTTIQEHSGMYRRILIPAIGEIRLVDLLPIHTAEIAKVAYQCGKSAHRHAIITLRCLVKFVRKNRWPVGLDVNEIEIPVYRSQSDVCAWSKEDIVKIREYLSRDFSTEFSKHTPKRERLAHQFAMKRTACLFEVLLHSGIRLSEALSIDKKNINWEKAEVCVEDAKEEGKWKTVYLHGALQAMREYLDSRTDSNPALFVAYNGKRLIYNTAQTTLKRLKVRLRKANEDFGVINHKTCRSTFITLPLRAGIDPKIVQNLAHHASLHMTLNYYYKIEKEKVKPIHEQIFSTL